MTDELPARLARNIRSLRDARGLTQQQLAKLAGVPRATWANLESGAANPTLAVLTRVAQALAVSLEELLAAPRAGTRFHPRRTLATRTQGASEVRKVLPDRIPGVELDRMAIPAGQRLVGVPHTSGTWEYLTCERGALELAVGGETLRLEPGDVVAFRGDQRHSYFNPGDVAAVGYSVLILRPARDEG